MLSKSEIARIKELSQKKKAGILTSEEQEERAALHQKYIKSFRENMRQEIEGIKIVNEQGEDVTPERVKKIQEEKGLHGRDKEEN